MIQPRTIVKIADNSGGKVGRIFKVLGGSKKRYAGLGDLVVLSVQTAEASVVKSRDKAQKGKFSEFHDSDNGKRH